MKNLKLYGYSNTGKFYLNKNNNRLIITIRDDKKLLLDSCYFNSCDMNDNIIYANTIFHFVRIEIKEDNFIVKVKRRRRKIINKEYNKIYMQID